MKLNMGSDVVADGNEDNAFPLLGHLIHYSFQHTGFDKRVAQFCNGISYNLKCAAVVMRE